jgi:hypothetical protein
MNGRRIGAIVSVTLAVVALVLGLIVKDQADFSSNYLHDQLAEKGITFTPVENLLPQQKDVSCLVANAGKPLLTGKQAECYAKYQIGIDLTVVDGGKTYFEDHYNGYLARVAAGKALATAPDAPETAALVKEADRVQRVADDLLAGEATRGLLLTAYGFSVIGDRLSQTATVLFVLAGLLAIAALVLFLTSRKRSPEPDVAAPAAPATT